MVGRERKYSRIKFDILAKLINEKVVTDTDLTKVSRAGNLRDIVNHINELKLMGFNIRSVKIHNNKIRRGWQKLYYLR